MALLPVRVEWISSSWAFLTLIAPPDSALLPMKVELVAVMTAPRSPESAPPELSAVLPENVELNTSRTLSLTSIAPPDWASFPARLTLTRVSVLS